MEQIPGRDGYNAHITDDLFGLVAHHYKKNRKEPLNTGFYHRWYSVKKKGHSDRTGFLPTGGPFLGWENGSFHWGFKTKLGTPRKFIGPGLENQGFQLGNLGLEGLARWIGFPVEFPFGIITQKFL